ncbi:MAG: polymer-forming cytoskeletal protein [Pseudomonadota bacterium]
MLGKKKTTSSFKGNDFKDHSFIASQTEVTGDISFTGGLHVEGRVIGNILSENGAVHVHGEVVGEIRVPHVVINGQVKGNIYAADHIELAAKAVVHGNVYYRTMEMMMGAQVNGSVLHSDKPGVQLIAHQPGEDESGQSAENG